MRDKKIIIFLILCIYMMLCLCSCQILENAATHNAGGYSEQGFEVHYIDVGQGDSALIICDGKTMLIDGGKPYASSIVYTYLSKLNINCLNYIVASHADDDHIGGLSAPLAKMKVENILAPKTEADTPSYESLKSKAAEQGLEIAHPKPGKVLSLAAARSSFTDR